MKFRNLPEADTVDEWVAQSTHPVPHTADEILFSLTVRDPFSGKHQNNAEYPDTTASARDGVYFIFFHDKHHPETMKFAVCSCEHNPFSPRYINPNQMEMDFCKLESVKTIDKDKPCFFLDLACPFTEQGMSRFTRYSFINARGECMKNGREIDAIVETFEHDVLGTAYMAYAIPCQ